MKAFVAALIAIAILGTCAGLILGREQDPAYRAFSTSGARVGDPGHNLVGPNWTGLNGA